MIDRFRIDLKLLDEDGDQLAKMSIYGATLEATMASAMVVASPHIQLGLGVKAVQTGVFCDACQAYHPCTERLLSMHDDQPTPEPTAAAKPN